MIINLNDKINVTLTSEGKDKLIEYYRQMFNSYPPTEEVAGEFQLWIFIKIFGSEIYMGNKQMIEKNNIELVEASKGKEE